MLIAGVDEAGRGPLAGPVVAAAVILNDARRIKGLRDSKLLTPQAREELALEIRSRAIAWAVAESDVGEIDTINILQATLLAMRRAIERLSTAPEVVWIDGLHCPHSNYPMRAIVDGDRLVAAIAAASILAKTTRDALMRVRRREEDRGITMVGPHRDDWALVLDELDARYHASQGEQRTLALGLRLAGHRVVADADGVEPVLLLDDVFSELDEQRSTALVAHLPATQTLITTAGALPAGIRADTWMQIENGALV